MTDPLDNTVPAPHTPPAHHWPPDPADDDLPAVPGHTVLRRLGRGGMGAVYLAHDPVFGRQVAVKVMHPGQDAGRFVTESRITARLPHPGIPPVYAMGELPDGRPFLTMKLVEGRTLADELTASDAGGPLRLLGAFERICETAGYAHSRGVVHRDLKPANVMVGSFGEVLVMDWGVATAAAGGADTVADTAAGDTGADVTRGGSAKGTPAYMAPEQARGEPVDARADVFALGGILAAVLTGKAPFGGTSAADALRLAARADLGECLARLDGCGADPELVAVAKRCLAADRDARFADGRAVAEAVAGYRAGVDERLRAAERERAVAAAAAREQRKRRRAQAVMILFVAAVLTAFLVYGWWSDKERRKSMAKAAEAMNQNMVASALEYGRRDGAVAANLKLAADLRGQLKFAAAGAALDQAAAAAGTDPTLAPFAERAKADLALAVALDGIRYRKWQWVVRDGGTGGFDTASATAAYRRALAAAGFDPTTDPPAEVAARVAASGIKAELVAALDDWALYEPDAGWRGRLLEAARRADPDPWRDRLRDPAVRADKAAVQRLAAEVPADAPPAAVVVLAEVMRARGLDPGEVLADARRRRPTDFDLVFAVGRRFGPGGLLDTGAYETARALRPDVPTTWVNLGAALSARRDFGAAVAALRGAIELDPTSADAHNNLGVALFGAGRYEEAAAAHRRAIELNPALAHAHSNLGVALMRARKLDDARAAFERAVALNPKSATAHSNLGQYLFETGRPDAAIAAHRRAVELDPDFGNGHTNLGAALAARDQFPAALQALERAVKLEPTATAYTNLGYVLWNLDRDADAIAAYKEAVRLDPKFAKAHSGVAAVLANADRFDEAVAACREAIKYNPDDVFAYATLGTALQSRGKLDEAVAAYKEVLKRNPRYGRVLNNIATAYGELGKTGEAVIYAREAIAVDPRSDSAHATLGQALRQAGDVRGAREALTTATRLNRQWADLLAQLPPPLPVAPPPRPVDRP